MQKARNWSCALAVLADERRTVEVARAEVDHQAAGLVDRAGVVGVGGEGGARKCQGGGDDGGFDCGELDLHDNFFF
jgi:hypothetical protein